MGAASNMYSYYFLVDIKGSLLQFTNVFGELATILVSIECHRNGFVTELNGCRVFVACNGGTGGLPFSAFRF